MKEDWKECKLGDLCIDNKGSYGIAASAVPYSENLYTYLRITDINDDGTLNNSDLKSVADENADKYLLKQNDIVFAELEEALEEIIFMMVLTVLLFMQGF